MTLDQILRAFAAAGGRIAVTASGQGETFSDRTKKAREAKGAKKLHTHQSKVHIELLAKRVVEILQPAALAVSFGLREQSRMQVTVSRR